MKVFWDPVQLEHAPSFFLQRGLVRPNFETPARAVALVEACEKLSLDVRRPDDPGRAALEAVHPAAYLDFLRDGPAAWAGLAEHGPEMVPNIHPSPEMLAQGAPYPASIVGQVGWFTADTSCPVAPETWPAAQAAAWGAVAAADALTLDRHSFALARPPGHHAYPARAGGHCYLNNAAIAAERLRSRGAVRVGILDIDSHHGNGTQGCFWDRDDVVFASVHGDPGGYYPWYVGHAAERGGGIGEGHNHNYPLPRGTGDAEWLAAVDTALEALGNVDALVVSLGFDASEHEPLGFLAVSADGFSRAGRMVGRADLPTALIQEGGYNVELIGGLLQNFIFAMLA